MSEADVVGRSDRPGTVRTLVADLQALGIERGTTMIVHSSLSAIGWVAGGAQAVVEALLEAIGDDGTLVMPTHSGHLSDPGHWRSPGVPDAWWEVIREEMIPYDPMRTPTRAMGAIVEAFRDVPGVVRSGHPTVSFAAIGPDARRIIDEHSFDDPFSERSPLARIYDLDANVLLLGVDHGRNTSIHLAEYRTDWPGKTRLTHASPVRVNGARCWLTYTDVNGDSSDFPQLGADFATTGAERRGAVGHATALFMRQRAVVDFAEDWLPRHRKSSMDDETLY